MGKVDNSVSEIRFYLWKTFIDCSDDTDVGKLLNEEDYEVGTVADIV